MTTLPLPLLALLLAPQKPAAPGLDIPHQKHVLDNGLQVVLHEDHSDPIVSVYVSYHVGSAREEPGRSGFAHLFEHMLFQGSQHVGDDQHFKLVSEAGGTLNGTTNLDRTLYFETLPNNQLELALWLESDRMGFLLPAVTQEKLDNQRDVVKNERRQNYENRPYAQASGVIAAALYPPDHPYSWITIGSQKDLTAASLEDVHAFFRRWYGPNNATLAIGGDIDPEKTLALVKKYFGSIPRGPEVAKPEPRPAKLAQTKRLAMEDKVQLPQLRLVWPTVPMGHSDEPALDLLASYLSQGKGAILEKALRLDANLARTVSANHSASELAGEFTITVTAVPGVDLDDLEARVRALLAKAAKDGFEEARLERLVTMAEASAARRLETSGGKTGSLAVSNTFFGDPNHAAAEMRDRRNTRPGELGRALEDYLLDKPCVALSVVPQGKMAMAATGRSAEQLEAEKAIDRAKRPESGPRPMLPPTPAWRAQLDNGAKLLGSLYTEAPLTTVSIALPAGRLHETKETLGLASLTASLLNEGTQSLDTVAMSEALEGLGATLSVGSDDDEITLTLSVLDRNLKPALEILADVVLRPRLDPKDFERIKRQRLVAIDTRGENITGIAATVWSRIVFGDASIEGHPSMGTRATVERLKLDDVRDYYAKHRVPGGARIAYVGPLGPSAVKEILDPLAASWSGGTAPAPVDASAARAPAAEKNVVYLVDKPGAAQSQVWIGHLGVSATDPDYYPLSVLNYVLGGAFSSRINMNLRESKGYTYGARSAFSGGLRPGPFAASGGIHTQYTKEAIVEFLKELRAIEDGVTDAELEFAKNALAQSTALRYESSQARMSLLSDIGKLGYPDDYVQRRLAQLEKLTPAELKALAAKHLHPDRMAILVVGDKAKVLEGLQSLGLGEVVELDIDGNRK